jgi:hypothetical protein
MQAHLRFILPARMGNSPLSADAALKGLKALSFLGKRVIIAGFPLPTPVLTPGWAIV